MLGATRWDDFWPFGSFLEPRGLTFWPNWVPLLLTTIGRFNKAIGPQFGQLLGYFGQPFNQTSGHTGFVEH